jgi:protein SCO1/2
MKPIALARSVLIASAFAAVGLAPVVGHAQARWGSGGPESTFNPAALDKDVRNKIGIDQKLGANLPLETTFKDESGRMVRIGDYFKDKPVVIVPIFFQCKSTCMLVAEGLIKSMNRIQDLKPGQNFEVVVVSINPKENPGLALAKKNLWTKDYKQKGTDSGWHMLTGKEENIRAVTDAMGFRFTIDKESDQIFHPGAIMVATPDGRVSNYLLGVNYPQDTLRNGILMASKNEIGQPADARGNLWGCMQYDPTTGKYRIVVENVLKVLGTATAVILFGLISWLSWTSRSGKPADRVNPTTGGLGA